MNSTGVLDDYLDELLGEAIAPAAVVLPTPHSAAPAPDSTSEPEREPTWDDLPAEVIYETDTVAAGPAVDNATLEAAFEAATTAEREPTWDDLPAEVIYETDAVAVAPAQDDAALEAAFEAAAMPVAAPEREPTWDDLPDEVIHEMAPAKAGPEPTWDDLPDEVIYETDAADSHQLAHTDSPGLQAAFEAAAGGEDVPTPPPAVV
ncbi:TPA: chemotaxis protein CheW, partial [Stenotrophomonas maltophilia]